MERMLKGLEETITYDDALLLVDISTTNLLAYMVSMVDEATDDEEERANAKTNFAQLIAKLKASCTMAGVLVDPDEYLRITFPEGTVVSMLPAESKGGAYGLEADISSKDE